MLCHYCRAPATHGYPDLEITQHCTNCSLVRRIHTSVQDARHSVRTCTSAEQLRRALEYERTHANRRTLTTALERRLRAVEATVKNG